MKQRCIGRRAADVEPLNDRDIEYEKNVVQIKLQCVSILSLVMLSTHKYDRSKVPRQVPCPINSDIMIQPSVCKHYINPYLTGSIYIAYAFGV